MKLGLWRVVVVLVAAIVFSGSPHHSAAHASGPGAAAHRHSRSFDIAHIREQGIDPIIMPLSDSFGKLSTAKQRQAWFALQVCAAGANLKGTVVPVWVTSSGDFGFFAPKKWHPFFLSIDIYWVEARINRRLTCFY